jgi:hypothetical protein
MRRFVPVLLALATLAAPAIAQSHPDFSGKWTLDTTSVQGPMAPRSMTMTITQDPKTLKIETAASTQMGDQKGTTVVNMDGSPAKNTIETPGGPLEMTSTTAWDGSTLVVSTTMEVMGQPLKQVDRYSLSSDGKLQLARAVAVADQNFDVKLSFNKN